MMAEGGNSEDGVRQLKYVPIVPFFSTLSCVLSLHGPMKMRKKKAQMQDARVRRKRSGRIVSRVGIEGKGLLC
jgi:hypothetical protein